MKGYDIALMLNIVNHILFLYYSSYYLIFVAKLQKNPDISLLLPTFFSIIHEISLNSENIEDGRCATHVFSNARALAAAAAAFFFIFFCPLFFFFLILLSKTVIIPKASKITKGAKTCVAAYGSSEALSRYASSPNNTHRCKRDHTYVCLRFRLGVPASPPYPR